MDWDQVFHFRAFGCKTRPFAQYYSYSDLECHVYGLMALASIWRGKVCVTFRSYVINFYLYHLSFVVHPLSTCTCISTIINALSTLMLLNNELGLKRQFSVCCLDTSIDCVVIIISPIHEISCWTCTTEVATKAPARGTGSSTKSQ